jgi:O-antigen ligase
MSDKLTASALSRIEAILAWWWAAFAFLYPFAVWPGQPSHAGVAQAKQYFTLFFVLVGGVLELAVWRRSPSPLRLREVLRNHLPALLWGLLFSCQALATLLSPDLDVALTGSLYDYADGLFWEALLGGVFLLAYRRFLLDPEAPRRAAWGLVAGSGLLALLASLEVFTGRAVYYTSVRPGDLPVATFPGKGHLVGYFVLAFGAAVGLLAEESTLRPAALRARVLLPALLFVNSFISAFALKRAGLLALAGIVAVTLLHRRRLGFPVLFLTLIGTGLGWTLVGSYRVEGKRELENPATLHTRLYYWEVALKGIGERPLFGWGGGVFEHYWPKFLSKERLEAFLREEMGWGGKLVEVYTFPGSQPFFLLDQGGGRATLAMVDGFRAHNQFLEVALKWGIPALAFYLLLLGKALKGLRLLRPEALGLFGLHLFFLFWFSLPVHEGPMWLLMAGAAAWAQKRGRKYAQESRPPQG